MKTFTAWAIDSQSPEGHGLLGRYFFGYDIPPSSEGCRIALFKTRRLAREHCKKITYLGDWKPKATKVKVTIKSWPF